MINSEARLYPGIPCNHPGCLQHVSHPCESCGRIAGQIVYKKFSIISPGDDVEREECSFCGRPFEGEEERINTCTHWEYVTLCRECYDMAGNSVR